MCEQNTRACARLGGHATASSKSRATLNFSVLRLLAQPRSHGSSPPRQRKALGTKLTTRCLACVHLHTEWLLSTFSSQVNRFIRYYQSIARTTRDQNFPLWPLIVREISTPLTKQITGYKSSHLKEAFYALLEALTICIAPWDLLSRRIVTSLSLNTRITESKSSARKRAE